MNYNNIINIIEEVAPLSAAATWDNSGVQVASSQDEIFCLAVCLDPTPESVYNASELGANMILSHHPLGLKPRLPTIIDNYYSVLKLLLSKDILLYSAHTSLDANLYGPASWLAEALDLHECSVLESIHTTNGASSQYGFGRIGHFSSPVPVENFCQRIYPFIGEAVPRLIGELPKQIYRVAFCPGAGAEYAAEAARQKADILITGDVKYHQALEFSLPVLDVGHFCLEEEMMRRFSQYLQSVLLDVTVVFVQTQDPLRSFCIKES